MRPVTKLRLLEKPKMKDKAGAPVTNDDPEYSESAEEEAMESPAEEAKELASGVEAEAVPSTARAAHNAAGSKLKRLLAAKR